jgi:hypothetical protein
MLAGVEVLDMMGGGRKAIELLDRLVSGPALLRHRITTADMLAKR